MHISSTLFKTQTIVYFLVVFAAAVDIARYKTKMPRYVMRGSFSIPKKPPDYCQRGLCPKGVRHIACKNPFWGDNCIKPYEGANVEENRDYILQRHNEIRAKVMKGGSAIKKHLPTAKNLPILCWDDELGVLAMRVTNFCNDDAVSQCVNTHHFLNVGRSSDNRTTRGSTLRGTIDYFLNTWFKHYTATDTTFMAAFPKNASQADYNLANLLNEKVTHVGCGLLTEIGTKNITYFTCLYNQKIKAGEALYSVKIKPRRKDYIQEQEEE